MTKKKTVVADEALEDALEVALGITEEAAEDILDDIEVEVAYEKVWVGGQGTMMFMTVARDQGEALNNLIEREPLLAAIGCYAEPMQDVDGCEVVALLPEGFIFGDDRRSAADALLRAEDYDILD